MPAIKTTQYRVDAKPFETELDARTAVMQYCGEVENLPSGSFNLRQYQGDGFYVLVDIGDGSFNLRH